MQIEFYIQDNKVDLFDDESIVFVDSIKRIRTPDKATIGFSKTFNVPATPNNIDLLGFYHNPQVINSFDARRTLSSHIQIGGSIFRSGQARLINVAMKGNTPYSYNLAFFDEASALFDLFGDDLISQIDWSDQDHEFNEANVRTGLQTGLNAGVSNSQGPVKYPLIYNTNLYNYTTQFEVVGGSTGLNHRDLKPAIKCEEIFERIATKYGITWASDCIWEQVSFNNVYLWCHRNEGFPQGSTDETQTITIPTDEWNYDSGDGNILALSTSRNDNQYDSLSGTYIDEYTAITVNYDVDVTGTGTWNWSLIDENTGDTLDSAQGVSGDQDISIALPLPPAPSGARAYDLTLVVTTEGGISTLTCDIDVDRDVTLTSGTTLTNHVYTTTTTNFDLIQYIQMSVHIPKISVIDYLQWIMKLFNCVIYRNVDEEYVVEPWDTWFARSSVVWNFNGKIIQDSWTVSRVAPFSKVDFKFKEAGTLLMKKRNQLLDTEINYGDATYTDDTGIFDGSPYSIEVGFEKILFNRLDNSSGTQTTITQGQCVDENLDPYLGGPFLFFIDQTSTTSYPIRWAGGSGNSTNYNRPSNWYSNNSINWDTEIDEHTLTEPSESLFSDYYEDFIVDSFNAQARIINCRAYIDEDFMNNYSLNDLISWRNETYRIEEISFDLKSRIANLKLLNIVD